MHAGKFLKNCRNSDFEYCSAQSPRLVSLEFVKQEGLIIISVGIVQDHLCLSSTLPSMGFDQIS